jgi:ribonucleoside-diphosphate reductase alpha chain
MSLRENDGVIAAETEVDRVGGDNRQPLQPAELPEICSGIRVRQLTPFGNMHINITVDPRSEREMEVFAQLGKGGDLANSDLEAICRMVSLWLRAGGSLEQVVHQLHSIGSSLQVHTKEGKIMSLGDGLSRALHRYLRAKERAGLKALLMGEHSPAVGGESENSIDNGTTYGGGNGRGNGKIAKNRARGRAPLRNEALGFQWQQTQYKVLCPDCHSRLRFSEGCVTCDACGFSKC